MVLAHQGGWDELALVIAPLAIIAFLLAVANRRANRAAAAIAPPRQDTLPDANARRETQ